MKAFYPKNIFYRKYKFGKDIVLSNEKIKASFMKTCEVLIQKSNQDYFFGDVLDKEGNKYIIQILPLYPKGCDVLIINKQYH